MPWISGVRKVGSREGGDVERSARRDPASFREGAWKIWCLGTLLSHKGLSGASEKGGDLQEMLLKSSQHPSGY